MKILYKTPAKFVVTYSQLFLNSSLLKMRGNCDCGPLIFLKKKNKFVMICKVHVAIHGKLMTVTDSIRKNKLTEDLEYSYILNAGQSEDKKHL